MKKLPLIVLALTVLSLSACGESPGERALSGGAIGAGVGAVGAAAPAAHGKAAASARESIACHSEAEESGKDQHESLGTKRQGTREH